MNLLESQNMPLNPNITPSYIISLGNIMVLYPLYARQYAAMVHYRLL